MKEHRPWGYYEVLLDDTNVKVKKIVVNKGCRLSLQSHKHRSETWTVVQGMGKVTIDNIILQCKSIEKRILISVMSPF